MDQNVSPDDLAGAGGDADNENDVGEEQLNDEDIIAVYELDDAAGQDGGEGIGAEMEVEDPDGDGASKEPVDLHRALCEFSGHSQDVFCVASCSSLVATGGEDDKAFVFRFDPAVTEQPPVSVELKSHSDSVVQVAFKKDGTRLAAGDLAGTIRVWDTSKMTQADSAHTSPTPLCSLSVGGDLHWLRWHSSGMDILLAGDAAGAVWMWLLSAQTSGGVAQVWDCLQTKVYSAGAVGCVDGRLVEPDGKRLCALYEDGSVRMWHLKESNNTLVLSAPPDTEAEATSFALHQSQPLFAVGSSDGAVKVCHSESGKVAMQAQVKGASEKAATEAEQDIAVANSVESIAFNSANLLAAGSSRGICCIWDTATSGLRHQLELPETAGSVTRISWLCANKTDLSSDYLLITATFDGCIRLWDGRTGALVRCIQCHAGPIFDLFVDIDRDIFLTAGGDSCCRVFAIGDLMKVD